MAENHFQRRGADFHPDPKIGRLVLLSLILHLVLVLVFAGGFSHHKPAPKRPVYYVDLSQLPVANPRAGRPDGQSGAPKAVKQSTPAPVKKTIKKAVPAVKKAVPPTPAKKAIKTKKSSVSKATPKKKSVAKKSAAVSQAKADSGANYDKAMSRIDKMRRRQAIEEGKAKLAALASSDSRVGTATSGASSAPLGMPDGTGDQAGVGHELWLQEQLTKSWSLSKYQVVRRDLEARVRISYNAQGTLTGNKFLKPSGDSTFDDSVTRAILKNRQLESKPGKKLEVVVIFNLKDLMD
jgi:colicin import membrane protein